MATDLPAKRNRRASADSLRQMAIDAAAEQITKKVTQKADKFVHKAALKADKFTEKTAKQVERLERLAPQPDALAVWTRGELSARRPRFNRDDIAAAAMCIADAEGFEALSMRRLAAEMDVGTMTLYHYLQTKDELLTLITDAFMHEVVLPPGASMPSNWRTAMTLIARRTRDALRRHPWVLDISDDPQFGPNGVRHFDQSLQALASLDVPLQGKVDVLMAVDEYVFGYCMHERNNDAGGDSELTPAMEAYLAQLLSSGDYPALQAMTDKSSMRAVWARISTSMRDDRRFDRNLARLLSGFEQSFHRG